MMLTLGMNLIGHILVLKDGEIAFVVAIDEKYRIDQNDLLRKEV
jgi:hypothetical protein